jgi:hypothetical protein
MTEMQQQVAEAKQKVRADSVDPAAPRGRSPLTGAPVPLGRPKGLPNKVTRTIREAVEMAARDCHPKGLAGWLVERAQGSLGDRQIFAAMVNKAMPLQVHANVDGGIRLELGWLAGRQVGTVGAQTAQPAPQVLDLQPESDGTYRIIDQHTQPVAVPAGAAGGGADSMPAAAAADKAAQDEQKV